MSGHQIKCKEILVNTFEARFATRFWYKRAQRALGRLPEEKVKGHRGANNREPQGHNLNNFGRVPFNDVIYEIWKLWAL